MVGVISTACLAMFIYARRGLQATIKGQADALGSQRDSEPRVFLETSISHSHLATDATDQASQIYNNGAVTSTLASTSFSTGTAVTVSDKLKQ